VLILYVNGIVKIVINAGNKIFKLLNSKFETCLNINIPTTIKAGAVAYPGTILIRGVKNSDNKNPNAPRAVRSTAPSEDGGEFSGSGKYSTKLRQFGFEEVLNKTK